MLRQAQRDDSPLGRKVKEIMNDGGLVDDDTMLDLVKERIARPDCDHGFILDGYPRTRRQAAQLEGLLKPNMKVCVFKIEVEEDEIVRRVVGRRTCSTCEQIYNIFSDPPKVDEKCDVDGSKLFRRADDTEEVVRKRIATYQRETRPLISHYEKKGVLRNVNGMQPEEIVAKEILRTIC